MRGTATAQTTVAQAVRALALVALPAAVAVVMTAVTAVVGTGASSTGSRELTNQLQSVLRDHLLRHPLAAGAGVSVTTAAAHGDAWRNRRLVGGANTSPVRAASVTKTFTAAAVLRLVEEGALRLDQPAADLLDPATAAGARLDPAATVRQLLQHTAGLPDYGTSPPWMVEVLLSPDRRWTADDLLAAARRSGRSCPPGSAFHYSDTGYVLLGLILERVTGLPLPAALRALLPMRQLPDTWLEGREPSPAGWSGVLHEHAGPLDLGAYDPSFDNAGGGGLVSTPADLDRFVRDLLEGRVLAPATVAVMLDTVPDGQGGAYGLGIGIRHLAGHRVWMHTGASGVAAAYVPDLQLSLAVATGQALVAPDGLLAATIQNVEDLARAHLLVPGRLIELADQPLGQTAGSGAGPCGTN